MSFALNPDSVKLNPRMRSVHSTALQRGDRDSIHVMLEVLSDSAREFKTARHVDIKGQLEREYGVEINDDFSEFQEITEEEKHWLKEIGAELFENLKAPG